MERRSSLPFGAQYLRWVVALCLAVAPRAVGAQAFVPAAGDGTVSVSYQAVATRWQLSSSGQKLFPDSTDTHALIWHVEYGLSDKLAVHASLPFMRVRYEGPNPHTIEWGQPGDIDNGKYHGSFQDFYVGVRLSAVQSPRFALTPFVEGILPSHDYETLGQAVVGRHLRALVVGAAVGGFVEDLVPGLFYQTRVSYAFVEELLNIRPNRTGIDSAVGYFVTPRLAVQFVQTFQYTHDGMDFNGGPDDLTASIPSGATLTLDHFLNHDRLIRSRTLNVGGGVTFAFSDSVGIFATATTMTWGRNIQRPRSITVGINWSFQTGRSAPGANPTVRDRGRG